MQIGVEVARSNGLKEFDGCRHDLVEGKFGILSFDRNPSTMNDTEGNAGGGRSG